MARNGLASRVTVIGKRSQASVVGHHKRRAGKARARRVHDVDDVVAQVRVVIDHEDAHVRPRGAFRRCLRRRPDRVEPWAT